MGSSSQASQKITFDRSMGKAARKGKKVDDSMELEGAPTDGEIAFHELLGLPVPEPAVVINKSITHTRPVPRAPLTLPEQDPAKLQTAGHVVHKLSGMTSRRKEKVLQRRADLLSRLSLPGENEKIKRSKSEKRKAKRDRKESGAVLNMAELLNTALDHDVIEAELEAKEEDANVKSGLAPSKNLTKVDKGQLYKKEKDQFLAVNSFSPFKQNPFGAIQAHIKNTAEKMK
jgi:hypothetical protein